MKQTQERSNLWDLSSIVLKNCIKDEWKKEFRNSGSITPFDETPDEKDKREKMKQEIEKITNPNPWDIKSLFENGDN